MLILMLGATLLAPQATAMAGTADMSSTVTITGVAAPAPDGAIPLSVTVGDLDGDGVADSGMLMLTCSKGEVTDALFARVTAPRDAATGPASGRWMAPEALRFDKASPMLAKMRPTYDIKKNEGGRVATAAWLSKKGYDYYRAMSLRNAADLCPAAVAQAAEVKATKSRSNIQNN